jgi:uncharacterized protein YcfJ
MHTFLRTTAFATLAVFSLSGCLSDFTKPSDGSTSDDDQKATKFQATAAGAALGALTGFLTGGDAKSALIGAAVGGGAGYFVGNEVAKRKQSYKNREELIAQESQRASETLANTRQINASLRKDIQAYESETKKLQANIAKGKARKESLGEQKQKVEKRRKDTDEALTAVSKELEISEQLYQETKTESDKSDAKKLAEWEKRISNLKKEKETLEKHSGQLQALSATLG